MGQREAGAQRATQVVRETSPGRGKFVSRRFLLVHLRQQARTRGPARRSLRGALDREVHRAHGVRVVLAPAQEVGEQEPRIGVGRIGLYRRLHVDERAFGVVGSGEPREVIAGKRIARVELEGALEGVRGFVAALQRHEGDARIVEGARRRSQRRRDFERGERLVVVPGVHRCEAPVERLARLVSRGVNRRGPASGARGAPARNLANAPRR